MAWASFVAFIAAGGVERALPAAAARSRATTAPPRRRSSSACSSACSPPSPARSGRASSGAPTGTGTRGRPRSSSRCSSTAPTWRCAAPSRTPRRGRACAAAYALLGLVVAPFLFFVMPRLTEFSLHPRAGGQRRGQVEMESRDAAGAARELARLHRAVLLAAQPAAAALAGARGARRPRHGRSVMDDRAAASAGWSAVNLVIWTGLFLYLLRLEPAGCGEHGERADETKKRLLPRSAPCCCWPSPASRSPRSRRR